MSRGRSSRCWTHRLSCGEPASRTRSVPASRSSFAWTSAAATRTSPPGPRPMWQWTSTRPGSPQPSTSRAGSAGGSGGRWPPTARHSASPAPSAAPILPVRCSGRPMSAQVLLELVEVRDLVRLGLLSAAAQPERRTGRCRGRLGRAARRLGLLLGALGGVAGLALLTLLRGRGHAAAGLLPAAGQPAGPEPAARHLAAGPGHLPHHRLRLLEPLHELVDLGHRGAGAAGDARAPRAVDDLRVGPLLWRHRADHRLDAVDLALVEVLQGLAHLTGAR